MEPQALPKPRKTPLLATNDQQLAAQAVAAAKYWGVNPWLTLRYLTAAFADLSTAYDAAVGSRQQTGSARPIDADELLDLDARIEANLYRIKARLVDKYDKKKALAYYPTLGISKSGAAYVVVKDRTKRAAALNTLVAGLKTEKIDDGDYGVAFWKPIATRYNELVNHLADANGAVSKAVAAKDALRAQIEQALSSLAKVLDANYPDDAEYKAELRAAGFQREKYR
ncbi:hypothetical protein [Hymenobacter ruricola]|uniref:Uncharacterized protein n=1 Tax=Hymenobacter ruricola TaxID=2791023 RepID=A0ABS0I9U6_9BACT|nr:hypothetical protein [Hymenobacter ruricola]MBF9223684.1 hypothetical protein [Hymenobacter ruricola]